MSAFADLAALIEAAGGGRVAHSGFLPPAESSMLRHGVLAAGGSVTVSGGFPGARRRVVTAHPSHVPEAAPPMTGLYLPGIPADSAAAELAAAPFDARWLGDAVAHQDGVSVIALDPPDEAVMEAARSLIARFGGASPELVAIERVAAGSRRTEHVVVPSLRVDAVGAKGFRSSRSWFTKGIAAGNVRINGERASKGSEAAPGDEIWAEGLGWVRVESVEGETRRGNLKAVLTVEKT